MQQPESPAPKPPVPFFKRQRDDGLIENVVQDRAVIPSFDNTRQSNGQLKIVQVTKTDSYGILQASTKDEESSGIF
jgi:hypothetical protein